MAEPNLLRLRFLGAHMGMLAYRPDGPVHALELERELRQYPNGVSMPPSPTLTEVHHLLLLDQFKDTAGRCDRGRSRSQVRSPSPSLPDCGEPRLAPENAPRA
jgi:hypothetical protein